LGLPWNGNNIEKMAEFLEMSPEDLVTRYYGDITMEDGEEFINLDFGLTTPCPFLRKDKTCQIYPVRPNECKAYPIETDFGRCGVDCPAMKVIEEKEEDSAMEPIYLLVENPEEKGVPSPPFGYICLGSCSHIELLGNEHIALSPQCISVAEIEWWAGYIRKHLDRVVKEAGEKFGKAKKRNG
jgi:Fe-S-cluster containining protein